MKNINCLLVEESDVTNVIADGVVVVSAAVKSAASAAEVVLYDGYVVKNRTGVVGKVVDFVSSTNAERRQPEGETNL